MARHRTDMHRLQELVRLHRLGHTAREVADQSYEKRLLRYTSPDLLILDDVGLRPLEGQEPIDLRARYERGAMVLTSNRAVEEWYPLFRDELMRESPHRPLAAPVPAVPHPAWAPRARGGRRPTRAGPTQ